MSRAWVVLLDEDKALSLQRVWDFIDNVKVAKVEPENLAEWQQTGYIEYERQYTLRELLENMELQN